jgi:hypothetical protein
MLAAGGWSLDYAEATMARTHTISAQIPADQASSA